MRKVISGVFNNNQEVRYCSKCGRLALYHYELNRGYGSQFDSCDGHICSFDLCDDCNEDWIEEVVNETPIIEDFGAIYPNEHKLVEFIDTFHEAIQDMIYYGSESPETSGYFSEQYSTNTYDIKNNKEKIDIDYEKLYLDYFGSEEEVAKAFEEMAYTSFYVEEYLSYE